MLDVAVDGIRQIMLSIGEKRRIAFNYYTYSAVFLIPGEQIDEAG